MLIKKNKYIYGFNDGQNDVAHFGKGHSRIIVERISKIKNEPDWMLKKRLDGYGQFVQAKLPKWGPSLKELDLDKITYYARVSNVIARSWKDVPQKIRNTFNKLGIDSREQEWLAGLATQYDSEMIYASAKKELEKLGVIFCSTDEAIKNHSELVSEYFGSIVKPNSNIFAALNTAFWSGGTFVYVPPNTKLDRPLQSYFRINARGSGQFERTLIIVGENSYVDYIEGCTAPTYSIDNLHAAVVEVFVSKNAYCKYTTIQNWSSNVFNLVTKSSFVEENGTMEWIDGNLGSKINMKYPSSILKGDYSRATCLSIAFASGESIIQDAGAKMIHIGKNTSSNIVSKSLSNQKGEANYRGLIKIEKSAENAQAIVQCDTMILDEFSKSHTIPTNINLSATSTIEHEATVSSISDDEIYYLQTKGLSPDEAREMIVLGFLEPFAKEIPLEYASELNKLIKMELVGSIG